jgi:hypothetical protein
VNAMYRSPSSKRVSRTLSVPRRAPTNQLLLHPPCLHVYWLKLDDLQTSLAAQPALNTLDVRSRWSVPLSPYIQYSIVLAASRSLVGVHQARLSLVTPCASTVLCVGGVYPTERDNS